MRSLLIFTIVQFSLLLAANHLIAAPKLTAPFDAVCKEKKFKGKALPAKNPAPGLEYMAPEEASKRIKDPKYVFIDTRPATLHNQCKIRKSKNLEFGYEGYGKNGLTKENAKALTDAGKTLVFYCNALKCHRSLKAAVQASKWGLPAKQIKWLGKGVPGIVRANKNVFRKFVKGKGCSGFLK